jgi:hypothetical protein
MSHAEAMEAVAVIADGIRVLRTRDGVALTEEQVLERARNIATGLMFTRLDGARYARPVVTEADFKDEGRIR